MFRYIPSRAHVISFLPNLLGVCGLNCCPKILAPIRGTCRNEPPRVSRRGDCRYSRVSDADVRRQRGGGGRLSRSTPFGLERGFAHWRTFGTTNLNNNYARVGRCTPRIVGRIRLTGTAQADGGEAWRRRRARIPSRGEKGGPRLARPASHEESARATSRNAPILRAAENSRLLKPPPFPTSHTRAGALRDSRGTPRPAAHAS